MSIHHWLCLVLPLAIGFPVQTLAAPAPAERACAPASGQGKSGALWPEAVPLTDIIESPAALESIASRLAAEDGANQQEARLRVARFAAEKALSAGEASAALHLLRTLWLEGEGGALMPYAALALRWPDLKASPSGKDALMAAALAGEPQAFIELARLGRKTAGDANKGQSAAGLAAQAEAILWGRSAAGDCEAIVSLARLALRPPDEHPAPDRALALLEHAVLRRSPAAAMTLATLHLEGREISYDLERAVKLLEMAGAWGHEPALIRLARLYLSGPLQIRSLSRAEAALEKVQSDGPEAAAAFLLRAEHAAGRFGGNPDDERSADLLARAQRSRNGEVVASLARTYLEGWTGWIDIEAGKRALERAVRYGDRDSIWQLAELNLLVEGTTPSALRLVRWAALQGVIPAVLHLRGMSIVQTTSPEDGALAEQQLLRAAKSGSGEAARAVAANLFYQTVFKGPSSRIDSMGKALQAAASRGSIEAALELQQAYRVGVLSPPETQSKNRQEGIETALPGDDAGPARMLEAGRALAGQTGLGTVPARALEWFRKCASLGDPNCFAEIAAAAANERFGGVIGAGEQVRALQSAAESGDARAILIRATKREKPAWHDVWAAARLGHLPAVAALLESAREGTARTDEAMRWLEWGRALALTSIDRALALARVYRDGAGLPQDNEEALQAFVATGRMGNAAGMREAGAILLRRADPEMQTAGEAWLWKAVELGDLPAMERLSTAYYHDRLGQDRSREAYRLALLAAYRGSRQAKRVVADALELGFGTEVDVAAAARWRHEAAQDGDTYSMIRLGERLLAEGGREAGAEALDWWQRAAAAGDKRAIYLLGKMHEEGNYVRRDLAMAEHFFRKAADAGHLPSVLKLSSLRDQASPELHH